LRLAAQGGAARIMSMRIEWQIGLWIGALALLMLLLWVFSGVLLPFAAAFVIAYLLHPLADRLQRLGLNRLVATLLILVGGVTILAIILTLLVPVLSHQFAEFVRALPDLLNKLQALLTIASGKLAKDYAGPLLQRLGLSGGASEIHASLGDLAAQAATWTGAFLNSLVAHGFALISLVSLIVVTPVVAFYMLLDYNRMIAAIDGLIPPRYRSVVRQLASEVDRAMAGFLRGQSLVCLVDCIWYGLGLSLIGLNFGLLIGITGGLLSFIPYVGSAIALVVASIVAIVQGWPHWNLLAMTVGVIVAWQLFEGNILSPKVVGDRVGLHPVWLIFALLAFGSFLGFTGLIIAVPVAAATGVILRYAIRRYRASDLYTDLPALRAAAETQIIEDQKKAIEKAIEDR
jgi:predicted PurR-regulated permease PerM